MSEINQALHQFTLRYQEVFQQALGELPRYYCGTAEQTSPCIVGQVQQGITHWKPILRHHEDNFLQLAEALETSIPQDLESFYTYQFAAPMYFNADFGCGELLQCWDQEDFSALQENLIGHVLMKRNLKQRESFFLAVMDEDETILVMRPDDTAVYLERVGKAEHKKVAQSLSELLRTIQPVVAPVKGPESIDITHNSAEMTLWQRLMHALKR
tara:strand:+ start:23025 stop:23663 length:639 start_codon:yes stop_codon:yes gene_type:complete